ncbi:MAG: hypothetical protein WCH39_19780, partial [Schlesneria sp.]
MNLYRITIRPRSPWTTPWHADTLWGLLCWACARHDGDLFLKEKLIDPAINGQPPFVLSDAFPTGWLPVPIRLRSMSAIRQILAATGTDPDITAKAIRKSRWITVQGFREWQQGGQPSADQFAQEKLVRGVYETHNQIGRTSNSTSDGGNLFTREAWQLSEKEGTL